MVGRGTVLTGSVGLVVSMTGEEWSFTLQRSDLAPAAEFLTLHGQSIGAAEVASLLPNWRSLTWVEVPASLLSCESTAVDREFMVTLRGYPGSAKRHDDLVKAFLQFMSSASR
jgi:hypothetical protein